MSDPTLSTTTNILEPSAEGASLTDSPTKKQSWLSARTQIQQALSQWDGICEDIIAKGGPRDELQEMKSLISEIEAKMKALDL